ncbi:MAG: protein kinase [Opitutales bacterium]
MLKEIDNYILLRKIGEGSFAKVFLVKDKLASGSEFFALKLLNKALQDREIRAVEMFAKISKKTNLVPILKMGFVGDVFYYTMPLADTLSSSVDFPPTDFRWQEMSLAKEINKRLENPTLPYFSTEEILEIISPIFNAVETLQENELLHRDIKPENILFLNGSTHLSDFGLLEEDRRNISQVGTPFYLAPSWYLNKGGNPDVYGIATTFYSLITGNLPDTIGRVAFRFPEKLKGNLGKEQEAQYLHWHRCILRAIAENPADRYTQISDFKKAIFSKDFESSQVYNEQEPETKDSSKKFLYIATFTLVLIILFFFAKTKDSAFIERQQAEIEPSIFNEIAENGYAKSSYEILSRKVWRQNQESLLAGIVANYKENKVKKPNMSNGFLSEEKEIAIAKSKANSDKETIFIMQERLKNENAYNEYLTSEYLKIQELLKKEESLNDL